MALLFIRFSPGFACYILNIRASDVVLPFFLYFVWFYISGGEQGDPLLKFSDPW